MRKSLSLFLLFVIVLSIVDFAIAEKIEMDQFLRRGETRATLDPNLFKDPTVRDAYRIAKEIPWVLDSIYCFCYCEESPAFRHKSLLSCYVDNHAAM